MPDKMTPPQLAKKWGISPRKVLAWIHAGELIAMNATHPGCDERPRWLIDKTDIESFEKSRSNGASKPKRRRKKKLQAEREYFE